MRYCKMCRENGKETEVPKRKSFCEVCRIKRHREKALKSYHGRKK